jgi:thiamine-phosphate pyrophosphorylase
MADLFLIAPLDAEPKTFGPALKRLLADTKAKVLLVPRGAHSENAYKELIKSIAPLAQGRDVAVMIEGRPGDVRMLGADGLHVAGGLVLIEEAIEALKPDFIVGAAGLNARHEAMEAGELDIDYVFFGPLSGPIEPAARELARWWAETMTVPSVLSDPLADLATADAEGCEFIALGEKLWTAGVA